MQIQKTSHNCRDCNNSKAVQQENSQENSMTAKSTKSTGELYTNLQHANQPDFFPQKRKIQKTKMKLYILLIVRTILILSMLEIQCFVNS